MLTRHGFPSLAAGAITAATALLDMAVGCAIAWRPTHARGLWAGVGTSVLYLACASVLTPELWLDPLGPLVKIMPAVALMLVAAAVAEDR